MEGAKETYYQAWEAKMEKLKGVNTEAYECLVVIPWKS